MDFYGDDRKLSELGEEDFHDILEQDVFTPSSGTSAVSFYRSRFKQGNPSLDKHMFSCFHYFHLMDLHQILMFDPSIHTNGGRVYSVAVTGFCC